MNTNQSAPSGVLEWINEYLEEGMDLVVSDETGPQAVVVSIDTYNLLQAAAVEIEKMELETDSFDDAVELEDIPEVAERLTRIK